MSQQAKCEIEEPGGWQAIHIFYSASSRPMITDCIRPLVDDLRRQNLLARYFFINYWLEGPHVRLRLRPSSVAATGEVRNQAEKAIESFLRARPALFEITSDNITDYYGKLFEIEYPAANRSPYVDENGRMRLRKNNTYSYEQYQPEYDRYGGVAGIELAEWHFQHSSDLVADLNYSTNMHVRTVRLGMSFQLMVVMASNFLMNEDRIANFFESYQQYWQRSFGESGLLSNDRYGHNYTAAANSIGKRYQEIRDIIDAGDSRRLPHFLQGWSVHCKELSERVGLLAESGQLVFGSPDGVRRTVTDRHEALATLLNPYIHMTNNRLSTSIGAESYLAYLIARLVRERQGAGAVQ